MISLCWTRPPGFRAAFPMAVLALLAACTDQATNPGLGPGSGPLTAIADSSGDGQSALRGTTLLLPLRITVTYAGSPQRGVRVTWEPSAGSVTLASSQTDDHGMAWARWTLGPQPGPMTLAVTADGVDQPIVFQATALPLITVTADPGSNGQTGEVGKTLPWPLRVIVRSEGALAPGVTVQWRATRGSVPGSSITDAAGVAEAPWILGTVAGPAFASASVTSAGLVTFDASALPGPPAALGIVSGNFQSIPANYPGFEDALSVQVTDQYGNRVEGVAVDWGVVQGPVQLTGGFSDTDLNGISQAGVKPLGTTGTATVRAGLAGGGSTVDFTLTADPPVWLVTLDTYSLTFVSSMNGTRPAVDTIPAGTTITWLEEPFDYEQHSVVPLGPTSFQGGGDFPWAPSPTVSVTFSTPGTYQYQDSYTGARGTVVVQ